MLGIAQLVLAFKQLQALLVVTVYAFENIMTCRVHRAFPWASLPTPSAL